MKPAHENNKASQKERESNCPIAPPSPSALPEGEYIAAYRGAKRGQWFCQQRVRLLFGIVDPASCIGSQIPIFATHGNHSSPRCKYYTLWVKANEGQPLRGDRMSPRVFDGYWKIRGLGA